MKNRLIVSLLALAGISVFSVHAQDDGDAATDTPPVSFEQTEAPEVEYLPPPDTAPEDAKPPRTPGDTSDPFLDSVNENLDERAGVIQDEPPPQSTPEQGTSPVMLYVQAFSALCLVLALIIFLGYAARRFGRKSPLFAGSDLGRILGQIHLTRGASLHFVRTADKVLVIGLTSSDISLITELDAAALELPATMDPPEEGEDREDGFLNQLQASTKSFAETSAGSADDDEIASLRGDIERLQRYLQEEAKDYRG